jgi:2-octaprenyl-6-methoxyphenol hydroxylase
LAAAAFGTMAAATQNAYIVGMSKLDATPVVVIGAGPAGLAAALALKRVGVAATVVAPQATLDERARDTRTFAALGGSVELLRRLGALDALAVDIAPLRAIRLIDARGGLVRAPEVLFEATEAGLDVFGYNIPQARLGAVLTELAIAAGIPWIEQTVAGLRIDDDHIAVTTAAGDTLTAQLVAAADGRASRARDDAGIATTAWQYPQAAVACVFTHRRGHDDVSTEFHGPNGPLTTVPLPTGPEGPRSSLVWVESPETAQALVALSEPDFRAELARHLQGLLGAVVATGPRAAFPLSGLEVATMAKGRVALIGEAGHVLPPIGAQGLNLGLRDAAMLADCLADFGRDDPGCQTVIAEYARRRARDVWTRTRAVDLLNRSLLTTLIPLDAARGLALHALAASSSLRRLAVRQGLDPVGERPRLMQPERTSS